MIHSRIAWSELRVFRLVWLVPMTTEHIQPWNCLNSDQFPPITSKPGKSGRGLNGELSGPAVTSDKRPVKPNDHAQSWYLSQSKRNVNSCQVNQVIWTWFQLAAFLIQSPMTKDPTQPWYLSQSLRNVDSWQANKVCLGAAWTGSVPSGPAVTHDNRCHPSLIFFPELRNVDEKRTKSIRTQLELGVFLLDMLSPMTSESIQPLYLSQG